MKIKRYVACLLSLAMTISSISMTSFATEDTGTLENDSVINDSEGVIETETLETETEMQEDTEEQDNVISDNTNDIQILADEEETEDTENWELDLVFYDSTVDNGTTPLTEINWDASDGGYGQGEARVITVQINYKNTNALTTYQPGELEISIPNLVYNTDKNIVPNE